MNGRVMLGIGLVVAGLGMFFYHRQIAGALASQGGNGSDGSSGSGSGSGSGGPTM